MIIPTNERSRQQGSALRLINKNNKAILDATNAGSADDLFPDGEIPGSKIEPGSITADQLTDDPAEQADIRAKLNVNEDILDDDGFIRADRFPDVVIAQLRGGTDEDRLGVTLDEREPYVVFGDDDPRKNFRLYLGDGGTAGGRLLTVDSQPVGDHLIFNTGTIQRRVNWKLGTAGDGVGSGKITIAARIHVPTSAPSGAWGIAQLNATDGQLTDANPTFNVHLHNTDTIRVMTGGKSANRRVAISGGTVCSMYGGRWIWVHVTWDGANRPKIFIDGAERTTSEATVGTAPAWSAAVPDDYFQCGLNGYEYTWQGGICPPLLINAILSADEIAEHARTGELPDWALYGEGSMVQQTSGSLVIGCKYRIVAAGGTFTSVGAADSNVGTEFVATGTSPTWGTGAVITLGPLFRPIVQPIPVIGDAGANGICGVMRPASPNGIRCVTARRNWQVVARSSTNGDELLGGSYIFADTGTARIDSWTIRNAGTSRTVSLGSASAGTQYASGVTASGSGAITDVSLSAHVNTGAEIHVGSDGTDELIHTISGVVIQ